jgi:hypothetical protein
VLLVDRLDRLAEAFRIAHRSRAIAVESVIAGMGLSVAAMGFAAFGFLPPLAGAVLQEAIDVAVILNALRVLRGRGMRPGRGRLTPVELTALKNEHDELTPILEQVRSTADRLEVLPPDKVQAELAGLNDVLQKRLIPHEERDDTRIYPRMARLIGGDDPMAAMSRSHREIRHLSRLLQRISSDLGPEGPDPKTLAEILRLLHGLDAILRLHFAQEDEIYHSVAEAA